MIIWLLPVGITAVGVVAVAVGMRRVVEEATQLHHQVEHLIGLRPAVVEARASARALSASLKGINRT